MVHALTSVVFLIRIHSRVPVEMVVGLILLTVLTQIAL
jgi:hypothetical protein